MWQSFEFLFDRSTPFLWAVVAVLVYVGGGKEHILALWMLNFTFYNIFHQSWCVCQIWWVFQGSNLDSSWLEYNHKRSNYITLLVLTSSYNLMMFLFFFPANHESAQHLILTIGHWIPSEYTEYLLLFYVFPLLCTSFQRGSDQIRTTRQRRVLLTFKQVAQLT